MSIASLLRFTRSVIDEMTRLLADLVGRRRQIIETQ
jgi:hypothetical protein